jgi:hypothetical protein
MKPPIIALGIGSLLFFLAFIFLLIIEYRWFQEKPVMPEGYELLCSASGNKFTLRNKKLNLIYDIVWDNKYDAIETAIRISKPEPEPIIQAESDKYTWEKCPEVKEN